MLIRRLKRLVFALHGSLLRRRHGDAVPTKHGVVTAPAEWIPDYKRSRIRLGRYEQDESTFVGRYLDPTLPTIELGSGIGVVSSMACSVLASDAAFVGVEGNPSLVPIAQHNVDVHAATAVRTVVHGVAVGAEADSSAFAVADGDFQISSVGGTQRSEEDGKLRTVEVPARTLTQLLTEHDFGAYQLICDIEGAEASLLRDDAAAFEHCRTFICELHGPQITGEATTVPQLVDLITGLGFQQVDERRDVFVFTKDAAAR